MVDDDTRPARMPHAGPRHLPEVQPLPVRSEAVVRAGIALWVLALLVVLAVPALHAGDRSWWPWACVSGVVLGLMGYTYVRRGRGNAADSRG